MRLERPVRSRFRKVVNVRSWPTGRLPVALAKLNRETVETREAGMFRITVSCEGITPEKWPAAMSDIREEFGNRQWHHVIDIRWLGQTLLLTAENDYDSNGEALADDFSDTIAAYAPGTPGYSVRVVAVAKQDFSA